jgi:hypothetical protein
VTNRHTNVVVVTYTSVQHFCVRWCSYRVTVTRRVSLVDEELIPLPEHPSLSSVYSGPRVSQSLVFCLMFCKLLVVLLSFFFWPLHCLSFDLRLLINTLVYSNLFSTSVWVWLGHYGNVHKRTMYVRFPVNGLVLLCMFSIHVHLWRCFSIQWRPRSKA